MEKQAHISFLSAALSHVDGQLYALLPLRPSPTYAARTGSTQA